MDAASCVAALDDALARHGRPEIFNPDQGSQVVVHDFTGRLDQVGIRISMDGHGRWMDDVFIERLWRSLEHEDVYLKATAGGREAGAGIVAWFAGLEASRGRATAPRERTCPPRRSVGAVAVLAGMSAPHAGRRGLVTRRRRSRPAGAGPRQ